MRTLVGILTSNRALLQLEAARCLHELSHSEQSAVAEACLPATSYLLTYLSGHSSDFIVRLVPFNLAPGLEFTYTFGVSLSWLVQENKNKNKNNKTMHTPIISPLL
jgi:hypothetical protein